MLTITRHQISNTVVLRCYGRIVRGDESALLCAALQNNGNDTVLDLGGVTAIDAAGIGALLSLQAAGIYVQLMNLTEPVRKVLQVTGMESVFEICEEGVSSMGQKTSNAELYIRESKIQALC